MKRSTELVIGAMTMTPVLLVGWLFAATLFVLVYPEIIIDAPYYVEILYKFIGVALFLSFTYSLVVHLRPDIDPEILWHNAAMVFLGGVAPFVIAAVVGIGDQGFLSWASLGYIAGSVVVIAAMAVMSIAYLGVQRERLSDGSN